MASPRHHFSPDVSPLDAEFEMQRAGVGEKRKSPSGARSPRLESDSSTIKSPKISDGHRRKMEKRRQLQEKLRRQVIASKTSVPEFEDIYFDLAATTQGMFDEWARPTKQFARSNAKVYQPSKVANKTCSPDTFMDTAESLNSCCLREAGLPGLVMVYENMLEFWTHNKSAATSLQAQQYEAVLTDYNNHWNSKTECVELLIQNWPVCERCYKQSLGLTPHRWRKINSAWEDSGFTAFRIDSKHKTRVRASPVTDFFSRWLGERAEVINIIHLINIILINYNKDT